MDGVTSSSLKEEALNTNREFELLSQACRLIVDAERSRIEAYRKAGRLFLTGGRKIGVNNVTRRLGKKIKIVADDLDGVWSELHNKIIMSMLNALSTENKGNLIKLQEWKENSDDEKTTASECCNTIVAQYQNEECNKLQHFKMALVDFLDRLEITLPRITCERAEKGSHFGASWVDFKCLNTQDIVKQRILHHLRIPACELAKDVLSSSNSSIEEQQKDNCSKGTKDVTAGLSPVALMSNVSVIAIDNFKRFEKNQISLRRGMVLKQVLAANQDGYAHGYKTSGKFCSVKKYGYYPANKVVLYEPNARGQLRTLGEPKPIGDCNSSGRRYSDSVSSNS